jgi:hypothetical protein
MLNGMNNPVYQGETESMKKRLVKAVVRYGDEEAVGILKEAK